MSDSTTKEAVLSVDGYSAEPSEAGAAIAEVAREALARDTSWAGLAEAGLLSLVIPEDLDGEGLGLLDVAPLLRAAGEHALAVPLVEVIAASLVLAGAGSDEQREVLRSVATGESRVVAGVRGTVAFDGETVTGRALGVPVADLAARLVLLAEQDGRPVGVVVDPTHDGVRLVATPTSRGVSEHTVILDSVPAEPLTGDGARLLTQTVTAARCLEMAGLVAGARDLTAGYIKERTQFGRALAEFQAVAQQIADVYIASRTVSLVAENAAWRVAEGLPADDDLAVAAYWSCVEAPLALATCHHLHGGMGVDITYPLHEFSSGVRDLVHALGGTAAARDAVQVESSASKNLELTQTQRDLKAELRSYFGGLVADDDHREMSIDRHGPTYQRTIKQMGTDGWMGVGWPKEYGGHGFGEIEQTIFANEAQYADVHLPAVTLQTVGPTLMRFGTDEQKEKFLGPILRGDVHFAIGYSEADAGTDLASLRCQAKLIDNDGDEPYYLVNGQKMWTTGGHQADYIWLAVRTDNDAPKHKGISILIVDTTDPGFSHTPVITADGSHHVNATFYENVKVPVSMRVGEENQGWRLITTQLNHERVMLGPAGRIEGLRDRVLRWTEAHDVADQPDVLATLAEVTAVVRVNELLNWEVARSAAKGEISVADASASKVFAADRAQSAGRALAEIVHAHGDGVDENTAELMRYLDGQWKRNIVITFGGGVTEVQKELISMFGLSLPRVPR